MNGYFGVRWNAPAFESAPELPCPVGEKCLLCTQEIIDGESGVMMAYIDAQGDGGVAPQHIECHLRSILGSVAHLEMRCTCYGGSVQEEGQSGRNYRAQARETMEWLIRNGR